MADIRLCGLQEASIQDAWNHFQTFGYRITSGFTEMLFRCSEFSFGGHNADRD